MLAAIAGWRSVANLLLGISAIALGGIAVSQEGNSRVAGIVSRSGILFGLVALLLSFLLI